MQLLLLTLRADVNMASNSNIMKLRESRFIIDVNVKYH